MATPAVPVRVLPVGPRLDAAASRRDRRRRELLAALVWSALALGLLAAICCLLGTHRG